MAPKLCSSLIVSLFVFFVSFTYASAGYIKKDTPERRCSMETGGLLTQFNQETSNLYLPCKYRLADFTCGDYRVKVTPGSAVDANYLFSPATAWVKVVNTVTRETVKLRTSLDRLEKAEAGTVDNPWKIKEGDPDFLDFAGYDGGTARLEQNGMFTVQFSNNSVKVTCAAPDFSSPGVPETLCGDGSTVDEIWTTRTELLGNSDLHEISFLQYIVLNDTTVTQSENCAAVATSFQSCPKKEYAHVMCFGQLASPSQVQCLVDIGTPPEDAYHSCFRSRCYGDQSNQPNLGDC